MDKNLTVVIVIGLIVVVVIGAPALINSLSDTWTELLDWVKYGFKDTDLTGNLTGNGDQTKSSGHAHMAVKVFYTDGTSQEFKEETFSILPLTITDETGKTVREIQYTEYIKLNYEGVVSSWSTADNWHAEIWNTGAVIVDESKSVTGTSWANGEDKRLSSITLTAEDIEAVLTEAQSYILDTTVSSTLTVTFTDETTHTKSGEASASWNFNYTDGAPPPPPPPPEGKIISISVSLKDSILYETEPKP